MDLAGSLRKRSSGTVAVVAFLGALELLGRTGAFPGSQLPPPSRTLRTLAGELDDPRLWNDVGHTLAGWGIGLALAVAVAVPLGIAIGSNALVYHALRFPLEFLRPIPAVALVPVVVLLYGTQLESKVLLVAVAAAWPLLIQTIYGIQDADPLARDTARSFRVGGMARLARITLPGAVPYVATGLRISSSVALALAVTAELVIGAPGLGRSIDVAAEGGAVDLMYALIVVTGALGWTLSTLFGRAERRTLHWHISARPVEAAP